MASFAIDEAVIDAEKKEIVRIAILARNCAASAVRNIKKEPAVDWPTTEENVSLLVAEVDACIAQILEDPNVVIFDSPRIAGHSFEDRIFSSVVDGLIRQRCQRLGDDICAALSTHH